MAKRSISRTRVLAWSVALEGGLGVVAVAVGGLVGHAPAASIVVSPAVVSNGLLATLPMLAFVAVLMSVPVPPLQRIRRLLEEVAGRMFRDFTLAQLALVSSMAGIGEELLFRGLLQGLLSEVLGVTGALVAASLVFGLAHMVTPTYAVVATLFGLYLGWLWDASNNLAVPIVAHAAYDFVALATLVHEVRRVGEPNPQPPPELRG